MAETGPMIDVSIIVLTWQTSEDLVTCLSPFDDSGPLELEIIIIDNCSQNPQIELLQAKIPAVKVIRNRSNQGVACARNQGMKVAEGRYILLLDADTVAEKGFLEHMVQFMEAHPDVGLLGPCLMGFDGVIQPSCRRFPTLWTKLVRRLPGFLHEKWYKTELYQGWYQQKICPVDYVIGACQLIRTETRTKVGFLDEKIFYGPEDVDYCLRIWNHGYRVCYFPEAKVIHLEQRLTKKKYLSYLTLKHLLGLVYYFKKHKYVLFPPQFHREH